MRHEPSFLKDILSACHKIEVIVGATSEYAATGDIPELRRNVLNILTTEFSESELD